MSSNTFDLVIFNHVIEHILDYPTAINELYRVLKPSGHMYLATPNLFRKLVRPRILFVNKNNLSDDLRIERHMGFSTNELSKLLFRFRSKKIITKFHQANNLPFLKNVARRIPDKIFRKYSQTNVFICKKWKK